MIDGLEQLSACLFARLPEMVVFFWFPLNTLTFLDQETDVNQLRSWRRLLGHLLRPEVSQFSYVHHGEKTTLPGALEASSALSHASRRQNWFLPWSNQWKEPEIYMTSRSAIPS